MLLYDQAYTSVKNRYVVPIANFGVRFDRLGKKNIKNALIQARTVITCGTKRYRFDIDKEELLTSLVGDINLFYLKYLIQRRDVVKIGDEVSPTWDVVTVYYEAFFAASLLLRLLHRGNIFLDKGIKNILEQTISQVCSENVTLDENQFFMISCEENSSYIMLRKADGNTHEQVWKEVSNIINEMCRLSREKSDEKALLLSIQKMNTQLGATFPSQLRNRVNYQTKSAIDVVERRIHSVNTNTAWASFLLAYNAKGNQEDDSLITALYSYSQYIKNLCNNLVYEYYEIYGRGNGVVKKFCSFTGEENGISTPLFEVDE